MQQHTERQFRIFGGGGVTSDFSTVDEVSSEDETSGDEVSSEEITASETATPSNNDISSNKQTSSKENTSSKTNSSGEANATTSSSESAVTKPVIVNGKGYDQTQTVVIEFSLKTDAKEYSTFTGYKIYKKVNGTFQPYAITGKINYDSSKYFEAEGDPFGGAVCARNDSGEDVVCGDFVAIDVYADSGYDFSKGVVVWRKGLIFTEPGEYEIRMADTNDIRTPGQGAPFDASVYTMEIF